MKSRVLNCPRCKQPAIYAESNPFRPFCSERCKLIDLGQWASESYAVAGEAVDPQVQTNTESKEIPSDDEDEPTHLH